MFSTFPDGWPGAGLLLLRVAAGTAIACQGLAYLGSWHELRFPTSAASILMGASGALLLIGYLTPLAGGLGGSLIVAGMLSWFPSPRVDLFQVNLSAFFAIVIAVALVCLGPGAFSLDARLFGRREIIIPDSSNSVDS